MTGLFRIPDDAGAPPQATVGAPKRVFVIGSSTGGPTALLEVFGRMPIQAPVSVVVAQHMPERFTRTFAERLDKLGRLRVAEAEGTQPLAPGKALICPGGSCIEIVRDGKDLVACVVPPASGDRYVPSADRLFTSAAQAVGSDLVAVVLTGMGDDGARGVTAVKEMGGTVLAEAPETAVIYGMPGAAARTGHVDRSLPLGSLAERLARLAL